MERKPILLQLLVIVTASFFSLYRLGAWDIMEWDEARNGVNAYQMLQNGDFVNLYYGEQLDTWNAKPPLFIWMAVLSFKLFGISEFAFRLPSVIAILVFFLYFFRLVRLKTDEWTAFLSSLILLGSNSIVARHMGISGDFDALLLCFLTIASYYFIRAVDLGHRRSIYCTALFTGLAFYTKGTAALLYLPCYFLYLLLKGKLRDFTRDKHTWLALLLLVLIISSWVLLVAMFGKTFNSSFYGSSNAVETMLVHDTLRRLTSDNFGQRPDYAFVFSTLDSKMNMWHYIFFAGLAVGSIYLVRKSRQVKRIILDHNNDLIVFSLCIILPLSMLLTFATNKHYWYLAPAFPYVAIVTASTVLYVSSKWKMLGYAFAVFTVFSLCWHFRDLYNLPTRQHEILGKNSPYFTQTKQVIMLGKPRQHIFLYITWNEKEPVYLNNPHAIPNFKGQVAILTKEEATPDVLGKLHKVTWLDDHCIGFIR